MSINCEHYRNAIDELLDGTLTEAMEAELNRHLPLCAECQQRLEAERTFRRELSQMSAPAMRPEFPAQVMARVRQTQQRSPRHWGFAAGFGSAVAAGLALWFAVSLTTVPPETGAVLQTVSLSLGKTERVSLVFDSPAEFGETTFALLLPENTELEGYPGKRELTWTASLRKGKNRLTLPIRVAAPGNGEIVARISQSDDVKVFRLRLNVRQQSGSGAVFYTLG